MQWLHQSLSNFRGATLGALTYLHNNITGEAAPNWESWPKKLRSWFDHFILSASQNFNINHSSPCRGGFNWRLDVVHFNLEVQHVYLISECLTWANCVLPSTYIAQPLSPLKICIRQSEPRISLYHSNFHFCFTPCIVVLYLSKIPLRWKAMKKKWSQYNIRREK